MLDEGAQCDGQLPTLLQRVAELLRQHGRSVRTIGRVLRETAIDRLSETSRDQRCNTGEWRRWLGDLLCEYVGRLVRFEGQCARAREVADDAQRVEIAACIHRFAERLLRAHELGSTDHL